jgi:hypothetical protein
MEGVVYWLDLGIGGFEDFEFFLLVPIWGKLFGLYIDDLAVLSGLSLLFDCVLDGLFVTSFWVELPITDWVLFRSSISLTL